MISMTYTDFVGLVNGPTKDGQRSEEPRARLTRAVTAGGVPRSQDDWKTVPGTTAPRRRGLGL